MLVSLKKSVTVTPKALWTCALGVTLVFGAICGVVGVDRDDGATDRDAEVLTRRYPENRCGRCVNHPKQADVLGATAVEDMCDGCRRYVRRPSKICATAVARSKYG